MENGEPVDFLHLAQQVTSADEHLRKRASSTYTGATIRRRPHLLNAIVSLTRRNMVGMYNSTSTPGWRWSNKRKRTELSHGAMRFIVVRSSELIGKLQASSAEADADSDEESDSESSCAESRPASRGGSFDVASSAADDGKDIAGYVAFRMTTERAIEVLYVHEVQVAPAAQGRGLGKYLMRLVDAIGRETDMKLLMLTVLTSNKTAKRFYEKIQFVLDEASPDVCYSVDDEHCPYKIMSKVLDENIQVHPCDVPSCEKSFRHADSILQHKCESHGAPWPFPCPVEGAPLASFTSFS